MKWPRKWLKNLLGYVIKHHPLVFEVFYDMVHMKRRTCFVRFTLTPLHTYFLVLVLQTQLWFRKENVGYMAVPVVYPTGESSLTLLVLKSPIAWCIEVSVNNLLPVVSSVSPKTFWIKLTIKTWFKIQDFWSDFLSSPWSINLLSLLHRPCKEKNYFSFTSYI